MTRILLSALFIVMLAADALGLNMSLAPGLSVKNAFIYAIFLSIAAETAMARNRNFELLTVVVPYGLAVFYALFSWLIIVLVIDYPRYDAVYSLMRLKSGFADHLVVFLIFFYGVLKSEDALSLLKIMIWTMLIANIITVVDALNIPDLGLIHERENGRVGGPVGEANQYAAILALFLPPIFALAVIETGFRKGLAFFGFGVSVLACLLTVSRGGVVGVIFGMFFGAIFLREYLSGAAVARAIGVGFVLCIAGTVGLYLAGYGDLFYQRFVGQSTGGNPFEVSSGRSEIWATALASMFENPLALITGYGWDYYGYSPDINFAPHNTFLKIFYELGIIGLSLVLFAFGSILRAARSGLQMADSKVSAMLFGAVFGIFGLLIAIFFVDLTTPWILVWAFIGIAMRVAVLHQGTVGAVANVRRQRPVSRPASLA